VDFLEGKHFFSVNYKGKYFLCNCIKMKAGASFQPEGIVRTSSVQSMFGEIHVNDIKGAHASRMANFTFCVY